MRSIVWVIIGLLFAAAGLWFGDTQSAPLLSGGTGWVVFGQSIPANIAAVVALSLKVILGLAALVLCIAWVGYVFNWLRGYFNGATEPVQVVIIMVAVVICSVGFGAMYRPFLNQGASPVDWLALPEWWLLLAIAGPAAFLLVNLIKGLIAGNSTLRSEVYALRHDMVALHNTLIETVNLIRNDVSTARTEIGNLLRMDGYKLEDGQWVTPATTINHKLVVILNTLGVNFDNNKKVYPVPGESVLDRFARLERAMGPHEVPAGDKDKKAA